MKFKGMALVLGFMTYFFMVNCQSVQAQSYSTPFITSITYQNIGTGVATGLTIDFYPDSTSTTPIQITRPDLPLNAGTSLYVGSLTEIQPGFGGSAVINSSQPLAATLVQVPQSTVVKNRPLSNGLNQGGSNILLATVLKNTFGSSSIFSVQNAGGAVVDVTIKFYNTSAALVHTLPATIQPGASYYVDAGQLAALGSSFNGSVVVEAPGGSVVASVMELSIAGTGASAFEGLAGGATKVYMPSGICAAFGGQNSAYAVQNTNLVTATSVKATYSNGATETKNIGPGSKASFVACDATGMAAGFSGSAILESTATNIVAIGKVYGTGLSTAFLGQSAGGVKLAVPYVRWSQTQYESGQRQRTYLAIQNVGGADLAAGAVTVKYLDKDGVLVATDTLGAIAKNAKANSYAYKTLDPDAAEFGYYGTSFGGSAIIEAPAGSQLVAIARVQSKTTTGTVAEDYNGITVQ